MNKDATTITLGDAVATCDGVELSLRVKAQDGEWYGHTTSLASVRALLAAAIRVAENYDPEPVGFSPIEQQLVDALAPWWTHPDERKEPKR